MVWSCMYYVSGAEAGDTLVIQPPQEIQLHAMKLLKLFVISYFLDYKLDMR